MTDEIYTTASRYWIEDGILKSRALRPTKFTSAEVRENIEATVELADGRPVPRLVFMDGVMYADKEGREMYAREPRVVEVISALALVGESHDARVFSEFASRAAKTPFPVAVFRDEDSAVAWLRETVDADEAG